MKVPEIHRPVTIRGTEMRRLRYDILDHDFELYIKLPWRYDQAATTYPILYCLDGNRSFPLYSTMSLILETPGTDSEEVVVVGIGYSVSDDRMQALAEWAAWRTRDFTPERDPEVEQYWRGVLSSIIANEAVSVKTGGAPNFLDFIQRELFPFIETNYRVSSSDRGLAGFSSGGLFTFYVLFHAPELFTCFYAGSPSMWDQLFDYEKAYASDHDDLEARVLITAGSLESTGRLESIQLMTDQLIARQYKGLHLKTVIFEGEEHSSSYAAGVSRALRVLYGSG